MSAFSWSPDELPRIRRCGVFDMPPADFRHYYRSETHALHLYLYHAQILIGERRFRLRPGDITVSPAGTRSTYRLAAASRHWCVHFWPAEKRKGRSTPLTVPLHLRLGSRLAYFRERLRHVTVLHNRPTKKERDRRTWQSMASAAFLELLLQLAVFARTKPARAAARASDRALVRARELIEESLSRPLDVPALAAEVGLSQNYLARLFRRDSGMTLQGYLNSRRMEEARHLLENTDLPVKSIAARVGYFDAQYFNKQFRRSSGLSPTAFRQQAMTKGRTS
jgi:AraC-like DNA-binding protein